MRLHITLHLSQVVSQITEQKLPFYQHGFFYCLTKAELSVIIRVSLHSVHSDTPHSANFLLFFFSKFLPWIFQLSIWVYLLPPPFPFLVKLI